MKTKNLVHTFFVALMVLTFSACGKSPTGPGSSKVSVSPNTFTMMQFQRSTFTMSYNDSPVQVDNNWCTSPAGIMEIVYGFPSQVQLTAKNVGEFKITCVMPNGDSGFASVIVTSAPTGPETITITSADKLIYTRDSSSMVRPELRDLPPQFIVAINGSSANNKYCTSFTWDKGNQVLRCDQVLNVPARGAQHITYVTDPTINGVVGNGISFQGQGVPKLPCPASFVAPCSVALLTIYSAVQSLTSSWFVKMPWVRS